MKQMERLSVPDKAGLEANKLTRLLMGSLGLSMGKGAICNSGMFIVRYTVLNTMHTLIFFVKERSVSEITFWLDKSGDRVTAVSIPQNAESMQKMPRQAINYLESIRRIAGKHLEASFMKGPGAWKNQTRARLH